MISSSAVWDGYDECCSERDLLQFHHIMFVFLSMKSMLSTLFMSPDRALELCESRGGRPGLPVPNKPYGLCGRKATLSITVSVVNVDCQCGQCYNLTQQQQQQQHFANNALFNIIF